MSIPSADAAAIPHLTSTWDRSDRLGAWKVRWGIGRDRYTVEPGLYRIGEPDSASPVLVTCNYKLTVDVVRRDLPQTAAWLLVLDTKGVNVWCAAGKGTFSTDELIRRLLASDLPLLVEHTTLVVPQLGATGVAAHEVRRATGWRVVFGPVRSGDLPAFLAGNMKATPEMRAVTFGLAERAVLAPVELVGSFGGKRWLIPVVLAVLGGALSWANPTVLGDPASAWLLLAAYLAGVVGGAIAVPLLLPWLPGRAFSVKGAVAGGVLGALVGFSLGAVPLATAAGALVSAATASFIGLNFTGSTPYTSPSGVELELRRSLPIQAIALVVALLLVLAQNFVR